MAASQAGARPLVDRAPAKVNLFLRVLGRRPDGYHALESLVAFAGLADTLTLAPDGPLTIAVRGPFAADAGPSEDNLVVKAARAAAAAIPGLRLGRFTLVKNVPAGAGLGGGSSDAAAALRLLARANRLAPDDPRLAALAPSLGADVPVCLDPRPRMMRGAGERLSPPIALPPLPALLVNPRRALATRDVFAALRAPALADTPASGGEDGAFATRAAAIAHLAPRANDLEAVAARLEPAVAEVLHLLRTLEEARLVRMSGSGASCFALFGSQAAARRASGALVRARPHWWVRATVLG